MPTSPNPRTRRDVLALAGGLVLLAHSEAPGSYSGTALVIASDHEIGGKDGIGWVELRFRDGQAVSVGGDVETDLMKWLIAHRGEWVSLALA